MNCLKVKDLFNCIIKLEKKYGEKFLEIPVVLGDDEELNGVHLAFFCQEEDTSDAKEVSFADVDSGKITIEEYSVVDLHYQLAEETNWVDNNGERHKYKGVTLLIS